MQRKSRTMRSVAVATAVATLASVGIAAGTGEVASAAASPPVTTIVFASQGISTPQQIQEWNALDKQFELYPSIKVNLNAAGNEIKTVIGTQLRSGNGPDLVEESPGPAFIGALAQAGLGTTSALPIRRTDGTKGLSMGAVVGNDQRATVCSSRRGRRNRHIL